MQKRSVAGYSALFVLVVTVGVICVVNGARRIGHPFPGFLVSSNRIVVSVGRARWPLEKARRTLWASVVAVDGRPVRSGTEIEALLAHRAPGTSVTYRFRKHADVFSAAGELQQFQRSDFLALYFAYFAIGLCFAIAGWAVAIGRPRPRAAAVPAFFMACQTIALVLFTGGDVYGPYWFTALYFTAHCAVPAALWHFTVTYPEALFSRLWGRVAVVCAYLGMGVLAIALNLAAAEPSSFLPVLYATYLILANAFVLYVGRVTLAWWSTDEPRLARRARWAFAGAVLSATVPAALFVSYPRFHSLVLPWFMATPLLAFPLLTSFAVARVDAAAAPALLPSVRRRLSLLFLAAAETAYVIGVVVFWLNHSWAQLLSDVSLNQRQQTLVAQLLKDPLASSANDLAAIESLIQSTRESELMAEATVAVRDHKEGQAREAMQELAKRYRLMGRRLQQRGLWLSPFDEILFLAVIALGVAQAVGFVIAVRRWLMSPVQELAVATKIIATGDLGHRVEVSSVEEFNALGNAINAMAASLADIQARVAAERETRRQAAATARDAERRRLARELHDGTLQDLSAVKLQIEGAMRLTPGNQLGGAIDGLIEVIVGLRRIVDDFAAPDLSRESLSQAIVSYATAMAQGHNLGLDLQIDSTAPVPEWASRDLYRIAQEAIGNAVRHGAPKHLAVTLRANAAGSVLEIADDGTGFDLQSVTLGTGIQGLRERAAAIGAQLDILAAPGQGTRVRLTLPTADVRPG